MNQFTKDLTKILVGGGNIQECFRQHLEEALNKVMKAELSSFLGYEKHDPSGIGTGNSRNGYYGRTFNTEYGTIELRIPRDRNGEFSQQTIPAHKRNNDTLEQTIIHLYKNGVTTREIAQLVERLYGHHYSPQTISNITKVLGEHVEAFHNRKLAKKYVCVYIDATYIPLRRETVSKEAVYIALGIKEDGTKEIIDFLIAPNESAANWKELLQSIQERGTEEVLLFISDGLQGVVDAISQVFPKAKYQSCLVHVARNISHKVKVKDRAEVLDDFKEVYSASSKEKGQEALNAFCMKWGKKYPKVVKKLAENPFLLTFYGFPKEIQRSLYSTNLIEGYNKQIKRMTRRKEQFPNEEALERFLTSLFMDYNAKNMDICHRGFGKVRAEISELFEG